MYLLQNHFRVIRRWNFESIDLYLWKLPIFFLGLFWIVVISLVLLSAHYGHNCQILSKYYHDFLLQKTKKQHTTWTTKCVRPEICEKYFLSFPQKYTNWDNLVELSQFVYFCGTRGNIFHIFRALDTIDPNFFDLDG